MRMGGDRMNNSLFLEKILQKWRFSKALPYLYGRVLDFGGNRGELEKHIVSLAQYQCTNDLSTVTGIWDNIACLAVLEHMNYGTAWQTLWTLLKHLEYRGSIIISTPTRTLHPILKALAWIGFLDNKNIEEHKYYWNEKEFWNFAKALNLTIQYERFQFGLNQFVVLSK